MAQIYVYECSDKFLHKTTWSPRGLSKASFVEEHTIYCVRVETETIILKE